MPNTDRYDEENVFTYHAPQKGQPEKYEAIRRMAKDMAVRIRELCPESRELSLARSRLEETVFWANAAIARTVEPPAYTRFKPGTVSE